MNILISLLAIFGLSFAIRQTDGPWGSLAWARNKLMQNKHVGVFFYGLLTCPFCTGFWCGIAVYLLRASAMEVKETLIYGLAGAAFSLFFDALLARLHQ